MGRKEKQSAITTTNRERAHLSEQKGLGGKRGRVGAEKEVRYVGGVFQCWESRKGQDSTMTTVRKLGGNPKSSTVEKESMFICNSS